MLQEAEKEGEEAAAYCHKHEEKCKKIFFNVYWTLTLTYISLAYRWKENELSFDIAVFKGDTGAEGIDLSKMKKSKEASKKAIQFLKKYGAKGDTKTKEITLFLKRAECFLFKGDEEEMEESFR